MIQLGMVPPLEMVAFLDDAALPWWSMQVRTERVRVACDLAVERGRVPPWLFKLLEEGLRRVACRLPCVQWGLGPLGMIEHRRVLGLWPCYQELHQRVQARRVVMIHGEGLKPPLVRLKLWKEQQYWLACFPPGPDVGVERKASFGLVSLSGKRLWVMQEEWDKWKVHGETVWALEDVWVRHLGQVEGEGESSPQVRRAPQRRRVVVDSLQPGSLQQGEEEGSE